MSLKQQFLDFADISAAVSGWVLLIALSWTLVAAAVAGAVFVLQAVF